MISTVLGRWNLEATCALCLERVAGYRRSAARWMPRAADRLTDYKQPREIRFIDVVPKTGSGKILCRRNLENRSADLSRALSLHPSRPGVRVKEVTRFLTKYWTIRSRDNRHTQLGHKFVRIVRSARLRLPNTKSVAPLTQRRPGINSSRMELLSLTGGLS